MLKTLNRPPVFWLLLIVALAGCACQPPEAASRPSDPALSVIDAFDPVVYRADTATAKADRVIIVVIDGVRYSEGFGDTTQANYQHIIRDLAPQGTVCTNFRNNGITHTNPGHATLLTGHYERISNNGNESPAHPSVLQIWRMVNDAPDTASWLVAGKGKLSAVTNTSDPAWHDVFRPRRDCGRNGRDAGSRSDSETWAALRGILDRHHPQLVMVNLAKPDGAAHRGDWRGYLAAIREADRIVWELWQHLQTDTFYHGRTALFITGDHGRHDNGRRGGFAEHGDNCEGCRRLSLVALGPDFPAGTRSSTAYEMIDFPVTIAHMLGLRLPDSRGKVMTELFGQFVLWPE